MFENEGRPGVKIFCRGGFETRPYARHWRSVARNLYPFAKGVLSSAHSGEKGVKVPRPLWERDLG